MDTSLWWLKRFVILPSEKAVSEIFYDNGLLPDDIKGLFYIFSKN